MKTRQVNIDRPHLSSETISSMKDFTTLKHNFVVSGTSSLSASWFAATIAGIALVVGISGSFEGQAPSGQPAHQAMAAQGNHNKTESGIQPENNVQTKFKETPFAIHHFKNEDGFEFIHETGSKITIPKNAFYNGAGKMPEDIEFHYREFHDPISHWLSGIPMTYDSLETYAFESAGMNELRAYANGEELQLSADKPIEISMVSFDDSDEMNLYALNDRTGEWTYEGHLPHEDLLASVQKDNADNSNPDLPEIDLINEQIAQKEIQLQEIPQAKAYNEDKHSFDLDVNLEDFPALKGFKNVVFEVVDQANFDTGIYNIEWSGAEIKLADKADYYTLILNKSGKTETILVMPVLSGDDLKKAIQVQEKATKKIQQDLDKLNSDKQKILSNYNKKMAQFDDEDRLRTETAQAQMNAEEQALRQARALDYMSNQNFLSNSTSKNVGLEKMVVRTREFMANRTGIFNFDCARRRPQSPQNKEDLAYQKNKFGKRKKVTLIDKISGKVIIPVTLFLIEKGRNLIYEFNRKEQSEAFAFNPEADNVVWGMTDDDKIAVFRSEDFDRLPMETEDYTLYVMVSPGTLQSKQEIERFLGLAQ